MDRFFPESERLPVRRAIEIQVVGPGQGCFRVPQRNRTPWIVLETPEARLRPIRSSMPRDPDLAGPGPDRDAPPHSAASDREVIDEGPDDPHDQIAIHHGEPFETHHLMMLSDPT